MIVNGVKNLFPLNKIRPALGGYFMDANGVVYSTRQYPTPRKMSGATAARGGRTYTFTDSNKNNKMPQTIRGDVLYAEAKRHKDWTKETVEAKLTTGTNVGSGLTTMPDFGQPATSKKAVSAGDGVRNHAATVAEGIASKGYMIGRVEGEAIVFGSKPVIHTSEQSAIDEVARLAAKSPGKQIIYVKVAGAAVVGGIAWA